MGKELMTKETAEVKVLGTTVLGLRPTKVTLAGFTKIATLVKSSSRYEVYDLSLENLVISMTVLHEDESTVGHSHNDAEEVYLFVEGNGEIQLDERGKEDVASGDIIMIPAGTFHRVFNKGKGDLRFISVFEKYHGRCE